MPRERIGLSGLWRFQPDAFGEGERAGWHAAGVDTRTWLEVSLPASLDRCVPGAGWYEGAGWFRRTFEAPEAWRGRRVVVRFEGVNHASSVWVNGRSVGGHEDGFLRFEVDATAALEFGGSNSIAARVDSTRRAGRVPGLERGWRTFGGILREVELECSDLLRLERPRVVAGHEGGFRLDVTAANGRPAAEDVRLEAEVLDAEGRALARLESAAARVEAGAEARLSVEGRVDGARAWSPETPALYAARIALSAGGEEADVREVRFGFRTVEARDGRLLLNGEPVYLCGFNRHEDSPRAGMCPDLATARADLEHMKRLGANFVRLCHYPHHPGELDLCDELGLLAMAEIPLYWWKGLEEGRDACARKLAAAKRQLASMIRRDANHAGIVIWSVSNETREDLPEVASGNTELVALARGLDPTRPATHVSNGWREHPCFEADDVVCVNAYPSWSGRCREDGPAYDFAVSARSWREGLAAIHERYPAKPVLVTEFGYPALEGVFGSGLGEDVQARAIEAEFAAMDAPYVCGAAVWCWADHPWPEEPFIAYLTTSPFGVVTRERRPKAAREVVGRIFRERRGLAGAPPPAFDRDAPDIPVRMLREHMRDLPEAPLPEGFSFRPMRAGEAALWMDVQRDAEEIIRIPEGLFEREFGSDLPATERRCFFVVDSKGAAVATASAWYSRDFKGGDWGRVHWVAARRAFRRRGIGRAVVAHALRCLAEHHERAWLATSTSRLGAIRMYLDFGFRPDVSSLDAARAWRKVASEIDHLALAAFR